MRAEVFICDYCGKQMDLKSDACLGALHFRDPISRTTYVLAVWKTYYGQDYREEAFHTI